MAELLECLFCGYKTVRCGMTGHMRGTHHDLYIGNQRDIDRMTKSLGQVTHWAKNRNQIPRKVEK